MFLVPPQGIIAPIRGLLLHQGKQQQSRSSTTWMWDQKKPYSTHIQTLSSSVARHQEPPWQQSAAPCSSSSTVEHKEKRAGDIRLSRDQWFEFCIPAGITCSELRSLSSHPHLRSPAIWSSASRMSVRSTSRHRGQPVKRAALTKRTYKSATFGYQSRKLSQVVIGCVSKLVIPMVWMCRTFFTKVRPCSSIGSILQGMNKPCSFRSGEKDEGG